MAPTRAIVLLRQPEQPAGHRQVMAKLVEPSAWWKTAAVPAVFVDVGDVSSIPYCPFTPNEIAKGAPNENNFFGSLFSNTGTGLKHVPCSTVLFPVKKPSWQMGGVEYY